MVALSAWSSRFTLTDQQLRELLPELAEPVWFGIRKLRNWVHQGHCPTSAAAVVDYLLTGGDLGRCNPECVDLFTVTLCHVAHQVVAARGALRNQDAFAATVATRFAIELLRKENVAAGGIARPDRTAGTPAVIIAALPPDVRPELLGWLLQDATRRGPVPAEGWNLQELADKLRVLRPELDEAEAIEAVRVGIAAIRQTAHRVAPEGWFAHYLDAPRERRRAEYQALPIWPAAADGDAVGLDIVAEPAVDGDPTEQLRFELRRAFREELACRQPVAAIRAAALRLLPADRPVQLDQQDLEQLAVSYTVELVLAAVPVDPDTHRLVTLPDPVQLQRILRPDGSADDPLDARFLRLLYAALSTHTDSRPPALVRQSRARR